MPGQAFCCMGKAKGLRCGQRKLSGLIIKKNYIIGNVKWLKTTEKYVIVTNIRGYQKRNIDKTTIK